VLYQNKTFTLPVAGNRTTQEAWDALWKMTSIAVLMPTIASHAAFRSAAEKCFHEQIYPLHWNVELLVDEHETDSLGKKLNRMIAGTKADYIVLWDDDDVYSPFRIHHQVEPLLKDFELTGTSTILYRQPSTQRSWIYTGDGNWLGGMAFRRSLWERMPFLDTSSGVDTLWQRAVKAKSFDLRDPNLIVGTIHATNTCPKHTTGRQWKEVPWA